MRIVFDMPGTGKLVMIGERPHIVLVSSLRSAIRTDGILRDVNGAALGRVVSYGLEPGSRYVWVELSEVLDEPN